MFIVIGLSFYYIACLDSRDFLCIFLLNVFGLVSFVGPIVDIGPIVVFLFDFDVATIILTMMVVE